ncbi:MAG: S41 family peptidase [Bdellovibrionales bacterium]
MYIKKKFIIILVSLMSLTVVADRYSSLELFAQVLNLIKKYSFKEVQLETLVQGAIKGLLREVDVHSQFFDSQQMQNLKEQVEGSFYGIGIEVDSKKGSLIIISIVKNSPADKAGLKKGDKLLKVNQSRVKNFTVGEFSELFHKPKKRYTLVVLRKGTKQALSFKVKSTKIRIKSVKFKKIKDDFYYLRIYYFSKKTTLEINKKLKPLSNIQGLVLDLRSNPGGDLDQAVKVADLFLDKGVIVYYKTKPDPKDQILKAHFSDTLGSFPLVVLIDEYSASASEVVAGALKDHKRALLVGRKSFGKGSIQTIFPIKDRWALKLTVGEYKTPSKKSIDGHGIEPHITLPTSLKDPKKITSLLEDPDIQKAFEELKKQKNQ